MFVLYQGTRARTSGPAAYYRPNVVLYHKKALSFIFWTSGDNRFDRFQYGWGFNTAL